ncbi:MAG: GTP-binding protein [Desulfobacula sp.]|nr:GTP-binding protein [Desulfobacula sp.]
MGETTHVTLITGFLGSGKTTFLNRIIQTFPGDLKLMILMNEFGEIGLDGSLIEGDDFDILEISKGSIFCVCVKTDFIRSLNEIAQSIKPDVLIVESTGVANPSDLKKDLNLSIFQNRFKLSEQICMIDADCFEDAYNAFVSVEKQIASSTLFIINKMDLVTAQTIVNLKNIIKKHHPSPEFFETTYADVPLERFIPVINKQEISKQGINNTGSLNVSDTIPVSPAQLEEAIDNILENPDPDATPPDRLLSAIYSWEANTINSFKKILPELPKEIVRAKGFLTQGDEIFLFNLVMGQRNIEAYTPKKDITQLLNHVVFIGPPEAIAKLDKLSRDFPDLIKKSVFDPMENN